MNYQTQESYLKAFRFAALAHQGQQIPGGKLPYVVHLSCVCMEVMLAQRMEAGGDDVLAIQCALLHDVIEDTPTTEAHVRAEFGAAVAQGVLALTKDETLPKALRMEDSLRRIRQQPPEIWKIKLADRITNLQAPPTDWSAEKRGRYRAEAIQIYEALKEGSPFLAARLLSKIQDYLAFVV